MKRNSPITGWYLLTAIFLLIFSGYGCKSYYIVSNFDELTAGHQTFAVLPFEMVFTGKKPEKLTDGDVDKIGEAESKAFMVSFYNEVLRSTKRGRKPIRISIQHYDKTLSILESNHIDIRASWKEDPGKLASLLGVDAVVKGHIEKRRLMSDLASYGIDLGIQIISILSNSDLWPWLPGGATTSKEIKTNYSLVDTKGTTLWSISYQSDADWRQRANDIIDYINSRAVKYFPYRFKKG
jgi:hypothetical protein